MILKATKPKIGPRDHGRKMSLKAFEFAQVEEGYLCELARGYIVVSDFPSPPHCFGVAFIRTRLDHYHVEHPDAFFLSLNPMECKLLIPRWESERHPDIAVYLTKPKGPKDRTLWRRWFPEFVIEVVSESSRDRDSLPSFAASKIAQQGSLNPG